MVISRSLPTPFSVSFSHYEPLQTITITKHWLPSSTGHQDYPLTTFDYQYWLRRRNQRPINDDKVNSLRFFCENCSNHINTNRNLRFSHKLIFRSPLISVFPSYICEIKFTKLNLDFPSRAESASHLADAVWLMLFWEWSSLQWIADNKQLSIAFLSRSSWYPG